ncbi:Predicted arabinose efflux permease, MFS family [Micromonospora citrea]|uniref:Predicted arabinose efflux permease, MFS family n=1 Tax=Micromonospora citrea TaxID=47855 RepID=A0A1C6W096_9ACTN|nr:MFS transporter [Micromonospora citrea]SCL71550.1 Predicted arabinose efflux permease, MFS family [Micromonospora citrea]
MTKIDDAASAARTRWTGVGAVAGAVFAVVTTEMLPVGLLTAIGASLDSSPGTVGLTMTVPGLVAAAVAPLVPLVAGAMDRRRLLVALGALLAVANVASAAVTDIAPLVALRLLVGVCIGGIWSVAGGLAVRLVPARSVGTATSIVFSGVAVASVLGVPAGALLGDLVGWRAAFLAVGGLSLAVTWLLAATLPAMPVREPTRLRAMRELLGDRLVRVGLVAVAAVVVGHFAAYTYVRPVLERLGGVEAGLVGALLLAYGLAGVAGTFVSGALAARTPHRTLLAVAAALGAAVLAVPLLAAAGLPGAATAMLAWGVAYGGVSVTCQNWLLRAAPGAGEPVTALFVAVFNLAIAGGALLGGRAVDTAGPAAATVVGGALVLVGLAVLAAGSGRARRLDRPAP